MTDVYDTIGATYSRTRRADARIVDRMVALLDLKPGARILDVGAGTGNYSAALADRGYRVTAVEPSRVMREQAGNGTEVAWVEGHAESLPFPDASYDGAVLVLCMHHFTDMIAACAELRRVISAGPILIFTYDPEAVEAPWLFEYFPVFRNHIRKSFPSLACIRDAFNGVGEVHVEPFLLPHDLADGFAGAAWRYPERYLRQGFRDGTSAFRQLDPALCRKGLAALETDLGSGAWDARYGEIRSLAEYDHGYVFVRVRAVES